MPGTALGTVTALRLHAWELLNHFKGRSSRLHSLNEGQLWVRLGNPSPFLSVRCSPLEQTFGVLPGSAIRRPSRLTLAFRLRSNLIKPNFAEGPVWNSAF